MGVARENIRLYLRRAQEELSSSIAAPTAEGAPRIRSRNAGVLGADDDVREPRVQSVVSDGVGEEELVAAADPPRLECRLGDGLAVLEEGEVDTVCIAGVGAYFVEQAVAGCWRVRSSVVLGCSCEVYIAVFKRLPPNWSIVQTSGGGPFFLRALFSGDSTHL